MPERQPNPFADGCAYIEGAFVPIAEARIPIMDRGFTRSDATYDVAHVWKGRVFRLEDHIDRFYRNMAALRLKLPVDRDRLREILMTCVARSGLRDAYLQMTCTRGLPSKTAPRDPRQCENRLYAYAVPFVWIANEEQRAKGLHLHISSIQRIPPQSVDPTMKNFHWIDMTRGLLDAYDRGADIDVLVDADGNITEGPGFNLFLVEGGRIATPVAGVFDGMTRRTVIELGEELQSPVAVRTITVAEVRGADEVFITSTAGGIMPVTVVDGIAVGSGAPGPVTRRIRDEYWGRKEAGWLSTPVAYDEPAAATAPARTAAR